MVPPREPAVKVWVLLRYCSGEGSYVRGVWSTKDAARAVARTMTGYPFSEWEETTPDCWSLGLYLYDHIEVLEYEVEDGPP